MLELLLVQKQVMKLRCCNRIKSGWLSSVSQYVVCSFQKKIEKRKAGHCFTPSFSRTPELERKTYFTA
jgi:hypothetical protein